ncbi:hypothetical protein [Culicoidibacter larvae]|uniref:Uncharacterized protein n=1 Tax=Culicoidibacter larvae TaxID=2579976 RepID=A0A5R8QFC4_9FIRM|nr:hypothetical protein [Culicoidibacter larvae]TLG75359.1 hypothetical protein FEZ08_04740 [Culicoidibacter larvae]
MNQKNKSSIPRDIYTPQQIIYSQKQLLGSPYSSVVITEPLINALLERLAGQIIKLESDTDECFEYIYGGNHNQTDVYKIYGEEMYYQPLALLLYDGNSISNYYIVIIDEQSELRQTNYTNLLLHKQIDNSNAITDTATITKMENTIKQLLSILKE